jgi:peptidoglycan/xylan/chitin deacetylase (PgdA/CDA1 family)
MKCGRKNLVSIFKLKSKFKKMRLLKRVFLSTVCCLLINSSAYSLEKSQIYEIGTWQGFKKAAISYTFDDGLPTDLSIAVPLFDEFGFKLTMFVPSATSRKNNWQGIRKASDNGHEVGSHSVHHLDFGKLNIKEQESEIAPSIDTIDSIITSQKCITMAYPYCSKGDDLLCSKSFVAVRGCQGFIEGPTPQNMMYVSSITCGKNGLNSLIEFTNKAEEAIIQNGFLTYLLHTISDHSEMYSPLPVSVLRSSLNYFSKNKNVYWVDTFGKITRYIKERNCASIVELDKNDSSITVQLTDTLENDIYNIPLTLRVLVPSSWSNVKIIQASKVVPLTLVQEHGQLYVMFDVIPDRGDIQIARILDDNLETQQVNSSVNIWVDKSDIRIKFDEVENDGLFITIYDVTGSQIISVPNVILNNGSANITIPDNIAHGVYIVKLFSHTQQIIRKIIL